MIVSAIRQGRYVIGAHAVERLEERGILEWQVVEAMEHPTYLGERHPGEPYPIAEFQLLLPDGTGVKAAWAWLEKSQVAKLATIFYREA
ncbi:MAG TPA: DUF4258 domain-containing protein [Phycisphaerae bacterium]|nr:DUF4258 domain-containing protein [Phycisphaerae bacterium]